MIAARIPGNVAGSPAIRVKALPFFAVVVLAAAAVRLLFLVGIDLPLESDEAIVGIMARHILYQGQWSTYYYGQNYLGPLEPASAALVMAVLGPTTFALRLAPLGYSIVFVGYTTAFARRAFGSIAARATALYLAFPPLFLATWSVKARGGYAEVIALGAMTLWIAVDLAERPHERNWRWIALGVLVGLEMWTDPLAVVYAAPVCLYLLLRLRRRLIRWTTPAAIAGTLAASFPMIRENMRTGGATLRDLAAPNASQPLTISVALHNLSGVARTALPVLLGFLQGSSNHPRFEASARAHHLVASLGSGIGVVTLLALAVLVAGSVVRSAQLKPTPADLLTWVAALSVALFAASQTESLHATEPRYLLPLYSAVPLAGAFLARLGTARREVVPVALTLALIVNARGWREYVPSLAAPILSGHVVRADAPELSWTLETRGDHAFYADYWVVYSVAFTSRERVLGGVIDDDLRVGFNRYIPYAIVADQSASPAVVVLRGSLAEQRMRSWLATNRATYAVGSVKDFVIFDRIMPRFHPL